MTAITRPVEAGPAVEAPHVPLWSWMVLALSMFVAYVVLQENGFLLSQWRVVHEFFHDARHAFGMPCH